MIELLQSMTIDFQYAVSCRYPFRFETDFSAERNSDEQRHELFNIITPILVAFKHRILRGLDEKQCSFYGSTEYGYASPASYYYYYA